MALPTFICLESCTPPSLTLLGGHTVLPLRTRIGRMPKSLLATSLRAITGLKLQSEDEEPASQQSDKTNDDSNQR